MTNSKCMVFRTFNGKKPPKCFHEIENEELQTKNTKLRGAIEKHLPELKGKTTRGPIYKDLFEALEQTS